MRSAREAIRRLLFTAILTVLGGSGVAAQDLAVVNALLVPAEGEPSQAPVTIVVSEGRIASIDPGGAAPDSTIPWIDAEGLFVVPGRAEPLGLAPEPTSLDWREEMLVRLSDGVTTLVAPDGVIRNARSQLPADYPTAHLVQESAEGGDSVVGPFRQPLEIGAEAGFLILEDDPRVDPAASDRPLTVVVGSRIYTRDRLELEARTLGEDRRRVLYGALPITNFLSRRRATWPRSCVAESDDRCLGPDPDCALRRLLLLTSTRGRDCRSPLAGELRQRFLMSLGRLATVAPSDEWIVGQRVNFALIERDFDHALDVVEGCTSAPWWCHALRGLVLHTRTPGSGGAAFDAALASVPNDASAWRDPPWPDVMDRGVFCEWRDVAYLIEEPSIRDDYTSQPCGERAGFEERFWWLADPLWSEPGNARRDEHVARNVRAKFRDEILRVTDNRGRWIHAHCDVSLAEWGRDSSPSGEVRCRSSHADWVRFGPPDSWRGVEHVRGLGFIIGVDGKLIYPDGAIGRRPGSRCQGIGHRVMCTFSTTSQLREGFLAGGYSFVPTGTAYLAPEASTPADWAVARGEGHERMETEATWYNLDQQTAVLRRGDSLSALSAAAFPTLLPSLDEVEGFLALGRVSNRDVLLHPAEVDRSTGVFRAEATIEEADWVVSLEASGPGVHGRSRQGAIAPVLVDGFGISKPVLVRGDFDPDTDDLLPAMVPSNVLPIAGAAGLYVELYGVEAGQQVQMSLSYEPGEERRSFFGRIGAALGIGGGPSGPVVVEWTQQLESVRDGVGSVFVAADLGDISSGEFELSLTAAIGEQTAGTTTTFQVR